MSALITARSPSGSGDLLLEHTSARERSVTSMRHFPPPSCGRQGERSKARCDFFAFLQHTLTVRRAEHHVFARSIEAARASTCTACEAEKSEEESTGHLPVALR